MCGKASGGERGRGRLAVPSIGGQVHGKWGAHSPRLLLALLLQHKGVCVHVLGLFLCRSVPCTSGKESILACPSASISQKPGLALLPVSRCGYALRQLRHWPTGLRTRGMQWVTVHVRVRGRQDGGAGRHAPAEHMGALGFKNTPPHPAQHKDTTVVIWKSESTIKHFL